MHGMQIILQRAKCISTEFVTGKVKPFVILHTTSNITKIFVVFYKHVMKSTPTKWIVLIHSTATIC